MIQNLFVEKEKQLHSDTQFEYSFQTFNNMMTMTAE